MLDLTNPHSFRNLSRPMGAQSAERLGQFLKRYREWDDPSGETPPYMYGTHYSSAMIVVSYLVRLEPFTQQFLKLQVVSFLLKFNIPSFIHYERLVNNSSRLLIGFLLYAHACFYQFFNVRQAEGILIFGGGVCWETSIFFFGETNVRDTTLIF